MGSPTTQLIYFNVMVRRCVKMKSKTFKYAKEAHSSSPTRCVAFDSMINSALDRCHSDWQVMSTSFSWNDNKPKTKEF